MRTERPDPTPVAPAIGASPGWTALREIAAIEGVSCNEACHGFQIDHIISNHQMSDADCVCFLPHHTLAGCVPFGLVVGPGQSVAVGGCRVRVRLQNRSYGSHADTGVHYH